MAQLTIEPAENRTAYSPGETLAGAVSWQLTKPATSLELRLFFYTKGKGAQDTCIVKRLRFDQPGMSENRPFSFPLPQGPYTFAGKLIALIWALELIVEPGQGSHRIELTIAPGAKEIILPQATP